MKFLTFSEDGNGLATISGKLVSMGEVYGVTLEGEADKCRSKGCKTITVFNGKAMADNVFREFKKMEPEKYDKIFIISSALGRDIAGMLASSLGSTTVTEVIDFSLNGEIINTKRFFFGGKTILEEESSAKIITVQPGVFEIGQDTNPAEIREVQLENSKVSIVEIREKEKSSTNIEQANILISVGRGLGKKEAISEIMPLVESVHGEISGSRPVCLDYKWLSEERQVGLSGKKVKPKIYLALGISGQIQHIAGMRGSKTVIAVNKDKDAPIFQECDYGIVGDLFQVVPKLVSTLKN